jgi:hypothetical protein
MGAPVLVDRSKPAALPLLVTEFGPRSSNSSAL